MKIHQKNRETLLDIAEAAIMKHLGERKEITLDPEQFDSEITARVGAFVSIYIEQKLRGCIGTFSEDNPLFENVQKMSLSAAFHDQRFDAVRSDESSKLGIEISVLTPRRRIYSEDKIEIGRHGIYMISGMQRGTLLPQVAVNNRWSALELLEHCAQYKVGIHKSAWKDAELYIYEAIVFSR